MKKYNKFIYWGLVFLFGAIIGWIYEEGFSIFIENKLENRGFMYGPYLPVYGFGSVFLIYFLKKYKNRPLLILLLSILITGILEYVTGYLMQHIFNRTWWDYTGLFLNLNGYVCLRSVLNFAVLTLLLIYYIEPLINYLIKKQEKLVTILLTSTYIVIVIDLIITLLFRY